MNRLARAHRSTKIPNVKLRPAQRGLDDPASSSSSSTKRSRLQDELQDDLEDAAHFRRMRDDGHDHGAHLDADFIGTSARPLKGAIISITGLSEVKATLTQYARELGARVEGNLTEDVTHLIADRPGSEKYRFALQLGMHIISPNWILDVRQAWLAGDDVDAEQLEHQHRLPALSNTTVCFSALTGADRRNCVALAREMGATVSDELRFDGTITHLVSATADPNASSSVHHLLHFLDRSRHGRNGTREQAASRILVVRPEWLTDCQKAEGCLSEATYSIFAKMPDQNERDALVEKALFKIPSPFVRQEAPVALPFQSPFVASSRSKLALAEADPLRRGSHDDQDGDVQDDDDEQPITLGSRQKAAAAAEKSFDNILSQLRHNQTVSASANTESARASHTAPSDPCPSTSAQPSAPASAFASISTPHKPHRNSLLRISRASSFSPAPSASAITPLNMRKNTSSNITTLVTLPHSSQNSGTQDTRSSGGLACFHGKSFSIRLDDAHRKKVLEQVLRDNGATVVRLESSALPDYVVVDPKASAVSLKPLVEAGTVPVLHFWIEYCLHHEFLVEPNDYFAALPALVPLPLPEGHKLRLLMLGFDPNSPELYHAQKLVAQIGGRIVKQSKGESLTHVVCATQESFEGKRAQRARSCGVPVVGLEFIIKARQTGLLTPPPSSVAIEQSSSSLASSSSNSTSVSERHASRDDIVKAEPDLPLAGCTVSRTKAMASQSVLLERKVLQLGACWQTQADGSTTHLIHKGAGLPREAKELDSGAFLVHPTWLDKCIEQKIRVDEGLFPSSMDPSKSLLTILSSSDGSASGNFLSQASQSALQHRAGSQGPQPSQQTQSEVIAAAKPWHRSISADAARRSEVIHVDHVGGDRDARYARGQSEGIDPAPEGVEDGGVGLLLEDVDFDADVTLSGNVAHDGLGDQSLPAPSSQTLFEGEEAEEDDEVGEVRRAAEKTDQAEPKQFEALEKGQDQMASADKVIELLNRRTLASATRKKNRLPPRARKQRSDDEPKRSEDGTEGMLAPEKVLEAQARLDAQRAAEAAAQGYSLGMDKDIGLLQTTQIGQSFDASVRIVYDDPAAMRERTKLLKMLGQQQQPPVRSGTADDDENAAKTAGDHGDHTEDIEVDSFDRARIRGAEDTFGAGRRRKASWESRNSESPTKRPVVRRQPLARR
ncbi:hypothetical protein PHSY_003187 [Pseudozyma hubeiensis SY62]|uniref:BRCT domain-containing protein n=1 Tax=Pseudozyma hubeiensis (strain SY62) TaxID=1305764 RepID=R9P2Q1_PSEHS|nr:hypothetical protein PHSY_003187 [Pseudozyma hubeiensis SY62]GAC95611.1 hypothetical protein PHSY_003187 [Pseudozyma hubeiensis SY62]